MGLTSNLKHHPHPIATTLLSVFVLLQMEVWLQQVGWPALEEPRELSLDMLLQAQGPFRELDQIAQVSLVTCSLCRYWNTLPETWNAEWVKVNLVFILLEITIQRRRSVVTKD